MSTPHLPAQPVQMIVAFHTTLAASMFEVFHSLAMVADSKQRDYGSQNLLDFGATGILVRANDKMARLKNLMGRAPQNETICDTWADLCNYAAIGYLMQRGMWPVQTSEGRPLTFLLIPPENMIAAGSEAVSSKAWEEAVRIAHQQRDEALADRQLLAEKLEKITDQMHRAEQSAKPLGPIPGSNDPPINQVSPSVASQIRTLTGAGRQVLSSISSDLLPYRDLDRLKNLLSIFDQIDRHALQTTCCELPPPGHICTRPAGHSGPCATVRL